ncbi:MAG: YlmC/YmxH family sporulation protein [bacterium]|nr:YlmC/YmxH family sporulation protein [bacterium]
MRLSELQHKDIVDLNGNKIGNIIDVKIDETGRLVSLIVEQSLKGMFKFNMKNSEFEITWDKIEKIGVDVILVRQI